VNKFSLLARMTCAGGPLEEADLLLPPGQGAHEAKPKAPNSEP